MQRSSGSYIASGGGGFSAQQQQQSYQIASADPVRASVSNLLSRAYGHSCAVAAQAYSQLVQPTARFQLALDALLPVLENSSADVSVYVDMCASGDG